VQVGIQNIDALETHRPKSRHQHPGILLMAPSRKRGTSRNQIYRDAIRPAHCHTHPFTVDTMLCTSDMHSERHRFWHDALVLEHGGKT